MYAEAKTLISLNVPQSVLGLGTVALVMIGLGLARNTARFITITLASIGVVVGVCIYKQWSTAIEPGDIIAAALVILGLSMVATFLGDGKAKAEGPAKR